MTNVQRINKALEIAAECGSTDGAHHKMWVIDQMVRALLDDDETYRGWVKHEAPDGWDPGIAP